MERSADALDGFAQQEGEGRQEETQQREAQSHVGDHSQCGILLLGPSREKISHAFLLGGNDPSTVFICRHRKIRIEDLDRVGIFVASFLQLLNVRILWDLND